MTDRPNIKNLVWEGCGDKHDWFDCGHGVIQCTHCGTIRDMWSSAAQIAPYDMATAASTEQKRLREVEQLAKELAARLNFVTIEWDGDDELKALIARARKLGLLG